MSKEISPTGNTPPAVLPDGKINPQPPNKKLWQTVSDAITNTPRAWAAIVILCVLTFIIGVVSALRHPGDALMATRLILLGVSLIVFPCSAIFGFSVLVQKSESERKGVAVSAFVAAFLCLIPTCTLWHSFIRISEYNKIYLNDINRNVPDKVYSALVTLKAASIQSEAALVGVLVALFTAVIGGLSILYSVFAFIEQRKREDETQRETAEKDRQQRQHELRIHQEDYNKDILKAFNDSEDVRNGKIILESLSRDANYLSVLHLSLYHGADTRQSPRGKPIDINKAKFDAAKLFYPNDGDAPRLPYQKPLRQAASPNTKVFTDGELVEVIPTLDDLIAALTPDDEANELTLLGNKICYSFDAFIEMYVMIGRLQIVHLNNKRSAGPDDTQLYDIDIWWDALDLPYWSRLIMWGTCDIPDVPTDADYFRPDKYDPDNEPEHEKRNKTLRDNLVKWKADGTLLDTWQYLRFESEYAEEFTDIEDKEAGWEIDSCLRARYMLRRYLSEYYEEALKIAFVLSVYGDEKPSEPKAKNRIYDDADDDESSEKIAAWILAMPAAPAETYPA